MIASATASVGKQNCITQKSTTFEYNVMYKRIPTFLDVISVPREKHCTQSSSEIFGNDSTHVCALYLYYQYII